MEEFTLREDGDWDLCIEIESAILEKLEDLAAERGITVNDLVNEILRQYIENYEKGIDT